MDYKTRREAYSYPTVGLIGSVYTPHHKNFTSTAMLDDHHRRLLRSKDESEALLGYLSVIYWGHYSSTDGRTLANRAAARIAMARDGQTFTRSSSAQRRRGLVDFPSGEAIKTLQSAIAALDNGRYGHAVRILCRLPQIQFAFATKLCAFINPEACGVMDSVLAGRLPQFGFTVSKAGYVRLNQNNLDRYDHYCAHLTEIARQLNNHSEQSRWSDRDKIQHAWRAIDVERALFS